MVFRDLKGYRLLHEGAIALSRVEMNGMKIDVKYVKKKIKEYEKEIQQLEKELLSSKEAKMWEEYSGEQLDISSNQQLSKLFFEVIGLEPVKVTAKGFRSIDNEVLNKLNIDFAKKVLRYRELNKVVTTYFKNILKETGSDGILHPFFHLHNVVSYRSSSSRINFQNLPSRGEFAPIVKSAFIPYDSESMILEADYSGIEVRVAACYNKDPNMIKYIKDPSTDMHRDAACDIFDLPPEEITKDLRYLGKNSFVFPQFYGDYYKNCAASIWEAIHERKLKTGSGVSILKHLKKKGIKAYRDFEEHLAEVEKVFWNERFFKYKQWKEHIWQEYLTTGKIRTLTGFELTKTMTFNQATNYPIQGSAFHCLLWSLIHLQKYLDKRKMKSKIIGQIHDSIVMNVYQDEFDEVVGVLKMIMVDKLMQTWDWIIVPLEVEIEVTPVGKPWSMKEEIKV